MKVSTTLSTMSSKLFSFPTNLSFTQNPSPSPSPSSTSSSSLFLSFPNPSSLRPLQHNPKTHFNPHQNPHHNHCPLLAAPPSGGPGPTASSSEEEEDKPLELRQAQEAFSELLRGEFGLSEEDSAAVAAGSPRYLRMLVDGVRELDELGLWSSMRRKGRGEDGGDGDGNGSELVGFKEKVGFMAKEKGDNGKVALLESLVGLSLASAMNVARYLSAESLPGLIAK